MLWFRSAQALCYVIVWGIANLGTITSIVQSVDEADIGNGIGTVFTIWNVASSILLAIGSVLFYAKERSYMYASLLQQHIQLTVKQHQQLGVIMADPARANALFMKFGGIHAGEMARMFKLEFIHGLRSSMLLLVVYILVLTLIVFYMARKRT